MANRTDIKILEEGPRNVVVRVTGVLDTADVASTALLTLAQCINNDVGQGPLKGFRVDHVQFSCSNGLAVVLEWAATAPQLIGAFSDANDHTWKMAGGLQPDKAAAGFTGAVNYFTAGWTVPSDAFTVTVEFVKLY